MATSGTKEFNPIVEELIEEAYEYCGKPLQSLVGHSGKSARRSINIMLGEWMNDFVPTWMTEELTLQLERDVSVYDLPVGVNDVLNLVIRTPQNLDNFVNIVLFTPEEYNDYPNREQRGRPIGYWFQRTDPPRLHFVYNPDQPYIVRAMVVYRPDTILTSLNTTGIPMRWHSAFATGLAAKLAPKLGVDINKMQMLNMMAKEAYEMAKDGENDGVDLVIHNGVFDGVGAR